MRQGEKRQGDMDKNGDRIEKDRQNRTNKMRKTHCMRQA